MFDVCTIVFRDEIDILKLQAQSLSLYVPQAKTIYVIVNDDASVCDLIDPTWWGALSSRVVVLPRKIFSTNYSDNGWVSQQALKLMTAAISYQSWTMILDAKTIFVRDIDKIFDSQIRPRVGQLDVYPVFRPSQDIVNQLFGINLTKQIGPGGVPFFVNNATVRQMISEVESRTQQPFSTWFQDAGMLTEFMLYSGYVQFRDGSFDKLYSNDSNEFTVTNVCHNESAIFDDKFLQMASSRTVSIHRNAWPNLNLKQQQQYKDFLLAKGIQ